MKVLAKLAAVAAALTAGAAQAQCLMNEDGYANVSGEYACTISCAAGGGVQGKSVYVVQNGGNLTLINEAGSSAAATISGLSGSSSAWGLTFAVKNNCREIIFSNSTTWLRK